MVLARIFISFLLMLLSLPSWALVSNPGQYGEKNFKNFYGAKEPIFETDSFYGNILFEENKIEDNYIDNLLSLDFKRLANFINYTLNNSVSCPNWEISRMYDYLRFANRIIALSYIYEGIKLQHQTTMKLGVKKQCSFNWSDILNKCNPKSQDMKLFIKSVKHIIKNKKSSIIDVGHSIKMYRAKWERDYASKTFRDLTHYRVHDQCQKEGCKESIGYHKATKLMHKSCEQDTNLFTLICSENDSLYGMSYIQEVYPLLVQSDMLTYFDDHGHAQGCLRRFMKQSENKEVRNRVLKTIFPIIYQKHKENTENILQGELFLAGSLKQFVEKGLTSVFESRLDKNINSKLSDNKDMKPVKLKQKLEVKNEDEVEFIDRYIKKKRRVKKINTSQRPRKSKTVRKSNFMIAVEMQQQMDAELVKVDMLKFKYDFLFSIQHKKVLERSIHGYTTRKGLLQMKQNDGLGTRDGPMPLIFLKYLIETNNHQGLYNILAILGDNFYVSNDIDRTLKNVPSYIELTLEKSTHNQWQINVLKDPEAKMSKKYKK